MKFILVDRIMECEAGKRITAVKAISLAEEYLADHFPGFPVLPGVLMLEALVETAAWLVRVSLDFEPSLIELREARNVIYKSFLRPGETLEMEAVTRRLDADGSEFSGIGRCAGREVVKARFSLVHSSLADENPERAKLDQTLRAMAREQYAVLGGPDVRGAELVA